MTSSGLGFVFALGAAASFGTNIAFARMVSFAGVSGTALVFYRVLIVLVLASAVMALMRRRLSVAPGEGRPILILSLASSIVGLSYLSSVAFIPVTVAVVILYMFPVMIVIATPLVDGTPPDGAKLGLAGLAFAGVATVVGPALEGLDWRGLALAAIAATFAAVQFFAAARCVRTGTLTKIVLIHSIILPATAAVGLAIGTLTGPETLMNAPLPVAATVLGYVIGFGLQLLALSRTSAAAAGVAFCAEPLIAVVSSAVILGEAMNLTQAAGGALVVASIALNVMLEQRRPRPAPGA